MEPSSSPQDPKYSIDTSSLIDGHRDDTIRLVLEALIRQGRLKAPPGVLSELEVGRDEAFKWAERQKDSLMEELSPASAIALTDLLKKYSNPFRDPQDRGWTYRGLIKKGDRK